MSVQRGFSEDAAGRWHGHKTLPSSVSTRKSGRFSVLGVVDNTVILSMPVPQIADWCDLRPLAIVTVEGYRTAISNVLKKL